MTPVEGKPSERNVGWLPAALAAAVLMVSALALDFALRPRWRHITPTETTGVLQTFWQPFFDGPEPPLVVYSNKVLVAQPDQYTGVGEVMAIHELDNLFTALHRTMRLKRGPLLTSDDAKAGNVIFIGSPSDNLSPAEPFRTDDFVFKVAAAGPRKGDSSIINIHPRAGEEAVYFSTADRDYAVIGSIPEPPSTSRNVMILAGITSLGTQAAVEFVCRPKTVEQLLAALGAPRKGPVPAFEALLRVKIIDGVPGQSELAGVHRNK